METTKSYFKRNLFLKNIENQNLLERIQKIDYYFDYENNVLNLKLRVKSYLNLELEEILRYTGEQRQTFAKAEENLLKIFRFE